MSVNSPKNTFSGPSEEIDFEPLNFDVEEVSFIQLFNRLVVSAVWCGICWPGLGRSAPKIMSDKLRLDRLVY